MAFWLPVPTSYRRLGSMLAIVVAYAVGARLGLLLSSLTDYVSVLWPASGVAVAAGLLFGHRAAIPVGIGSLLADVTFGTEAAVAVPVALVNSLEALLPALILSRVSGFDRRLSRLSDVSLFCIVAAGSAGVAGLLGAVVIHATLVGSAAGFWTSFSSWWFSAAAGAILVAPLILVAGQRPWTRWSHNERIQAGALIVTTTLVASLLFSGSGSFAFPLLLPLLVLAVARYEVPGACAGMFAISTAAIVDVVSGAVDTHGDFTGYVVELQFTLTAVQVAFLVFGAALAERRRSDQEQLSTAQRFHEYFDRLPVGSYRTTIDGQILEANPAAARLFGFDSVEELLRTNVRERYVRLADRAKLLEAAEVDARFEGLEFQMKRRDGEVVWIRMSGRGVTDDAGSLQWIEGISEDVSEARRLQDDLRRNEVEFRLLFNSNPLPMWVYDLESLRFLAVNPAAVAKYGYSEDEFKAMSLVDIRPAEDVDDLLADVGRRDSAFQSGKTWRHLTKEGSILDVEISSHSLDFRGRRAALVVALDVTERTRLERESEALEANLRQAQKMDAIGRLAGGIAHDFNNLVSVIGNYSSFVREELPTHSPIVDDVDEITNAADRAAALVRQLLAFSSKKAILHEAVAVNDVISDIEKMLTRTLGEHIVLGVRRDPGVGSVLMDRSQLEQILVNLAVNARDAMPSGGSLRIETEAEEIVSPSEGSDLDPGTYVRITVEDSGEGMSPEVIDTIFEPFFTTKAPGAGTGLGLSTVYGIVTQMGGHVGVDSEPGRGTTFEILLPATDELSVVPAPTAPSPDATGGGTILVVEDEAGVRQVCERILRSAGYEVSSVEDPAEAIALYEEDPERFDLILSDIVMPGMSGPDMVEHLRSKQHGIPTVFMSGYNEDSDGFDPPPATMLVNKPFDRDQLLQAVASSLATQGEHVRSRI